MLPKELGHLEKDEKRNKEINQPNLLSHSQNRRKCFFYAKILIFYSNSKRQFFANSKKMRVVDPLQVTFYHELKSWLLSHTKLLFPRAEKVTKNAHRRVYSFIFFTAIAELIISLKHNETEMTSNKQQLKIYLFEIFTVENIAVMAYSNAVTNEKISYSINQ